MTLHERLSQIVAAMPPDGAISLPIATLRQWVAEDGEPQPASVPAVSVDLTADEVARLLNRKPSTIRGWLAAGKIEGAYLFQNREWRVPRAALEQYLADQRSGGAPVATATHRKDPRRRQAVDLGAWRRVRSAGGEH